MKRTSILLILLTLPGLAHAAEVKIFRSDTREAVVEGTLEGVSVDPLGSLELSPRLERLTAIEEPFVFAAAGHPEGWVLGTGNSGKALLVDAEGEVTELAAVAEPEIFAVHADGDGTVFFASSPHGKVYRVAGGEVEEVFDPEDTYVWDLARDGRGRLLVATGLRGRIYRLPGGGSGDAEVLLESRDHHVRSMAVLADGSVIAGTAGQGLILRLADGEVSTLYDAVQPEVLAFAPTPEGTVYAAVVASEASQVDLSGQRPAPASEGDKAEGSGEATVVVVAQGESTIGSRSAGFTGPRSAILEISAGGEVRQILDLEDETVHSLLWRDGELWIGTGQEGRLYRWAGERLRQERVLKEEQQLAALAAGGAGVAVATTNAAAVYRLGDGRQKRGTYTSEVLDAGQVARFGSFLWRGSLPRGADLELAFRSGMSSQPDDTWTEWGCAGCGGAEVCRDGDKKCGGGSGPAPWRQEVPLGDLAHGRYVQWRATFSGGGETTPRLETAELTYRQENLRPRIEKLEVLDPGQILVPQSFNPTTQTFEPWSPNREGIFTTLRPESPSKNGGVKTLWKKGYQTLRWSAEDANEDELHYRLQFRPAADGSEGPSEGWLEVADELEETYYSFDATALPDGVYRFRLTASDRPSHREADALADEELSEPVIVDHTPPVLAALERRGNAVEVEVRDAYSPLRDAVASIDAGEWQPAAAADGLLDGRREVIRVAVPEGAKMVLLRLTDAHFNVVTLDLLRGR